jgi:hypothetical protein
MTLTPLGGRHHGIDLMQVCQNGHVITTAAEQMPAQAAAFCTDCGAATLTACPNCQARIPGMDWDSGFLSVRDPVAPNNCRSCGVAYPWRQDAIASAIEIVQMDMDSDDRLSAAILVEQVVIDTPRTEVSVLKLRRLLAKLGKPAYDVAIKVISDVASETAKKSLGLK